MREERSKYKIAQIAIPLVFTFVSSVILFKMDVNQREQRLIEDRRREEIKTITQRIRVLEEKKTPYEYVDKENEKQDVRSHQLDERINKKLDYLIERVDKIK